MSSIARNELDGVLLQLGTVYAREFVRRIRSDVLEVFKYFGNLLPKSAKLFQPDGTEPTLLVLRGTIPTIYKLKTYHTPIDIWIPAKYPVQPPIVYLTPWGKGMVVVRGHPNVTSEGVVKISLLQNWNINSNLLSMIKEAARTFGQHPPLRAKQPAQNTHRNDSNRNDSNQSQSHSRGSSQSHASQFSQLLSRSSHKPNHGQQQSAHLQYKPNHGQQSAHLQYNKEPESKEKTKPAPPPYSNYAKSSTTTFNQPPPPPPETEAEEKKRLIRNLTPLLQKSLQTFYLSQRDTLGENLALQSELEAGQTSLHHGLTQLDEQSNALQSTIKAFKYQIEKEKKWLEHYESVDAEMLTPSYYESLVVPSDVWSRQLLEALSEYQAIEDTLLILSDGEYDKDVFQKYLKAVRKLAGKQFLALALVNEIGKQSKIVDGSGSTEFHKRSKSGEAARKWRENPPSYSNAT